MHWDFDNVANIKQSIQEQYGAPDLFHPKQVNFEIGSVSEHEENKEGEKDEKHHENIK
jgi:hypothetical protein